MGGRPRKPTAVLELNGAYKKDPQRRRTSEPIPTTEPGAAPEYLGEDGALIWDELVSEGFWLTGADTFLLEVATKYMTLFRQGVCEPKLVSQLISVLNKLGFGPAERSKIKAPGAKEESADPFDQFT
jgi:hypothetical protein